MIYTLDLTFDPNNAYRYLSLLKKNYNHLHWHYEKNHNDYRAIYSNDHMQDTTKNNMLSVHGWGLQTIYNDPLFPYHCDIDPHDEGPEYFKDTPLVFGFFQDVKKHFDDIFRSFVMCFPAGSHIGKWKTQSGTEHVKVFLPIISNSGSFIYSYNNKIQKVCLNEGNIFVLDNSENFGELRNDGEDEISFITFNAPKKFLSKILELQGSI